MLALAGVGRDAEPSLACRLQGSSPAVDELAAKESGGEEAQGAAVQAGAGPPAGPPGEGPPEGPQVGRNIAHYRPYFSVYVPRTAARAIRPRGASDEGQRPRNCASLPSDGLLGARAPSCLESLAGCLGQAPPRSAWCTISKLCVAAQRSCSVRTPLQPWKFSSKSMPALPECAWQAFMVGPDPRALQP